MKRALPIKIYAELKSDRRLRVTSSSDSGGLEIEACTLRALKEKLHRLVADLLQQNGIEGRAGLIVDST